MVKLLQKGFAANMKDYGTKGINLKYVCEFIAESAFEG